MNPQESGSIAGIVKTATRRFQSFVKLAKKPNVDGKRLTHYMLSKYSFQTRRPRSLGLPNTIFIEATSTCNLHCTICPTGIGTLGRPKARMSLDTFKRIVDEGAAGLMRIVWAGYGEPFINPATYDMIQYAKQKRIFTEAYSNLLLLDDHDLKSVIRSGLDLVVVAVDFSPEGKNWRFVYKTERDIDKVKKKLRRLSELKKELGSALPVIRVSYPVTKDSEPFMEEARAFAEEIGGEFLPKTVNAVVAGEAFEKMKDKWVVDKYSRYNKPKAGPGHCKWPYSGALVYANGDVSPCCHLARGEHNLGNVMKEGVAGVWNGPKYNEFRRKLMNEPETVDHCANCSERFGGLG